jgi:hypothetical protein
MEYKDKFTIQSPNRGKVLEGGELLRWSSNNFYRTSTNDMSPSKVIKCLTVAITREKKRCDSRISRPPAQSAWKQYLWEE